jgi:hypothetical protein
MGHKLDNLLSFSKEKVDNETFSILPNSRYPPPPPHHPPETPKSKFKVRKQCCPLLVSKLKVRSSEKMNLFLTKFPSKENQSLHTKQLNSLRTSLITLIS